MSLNFTKAVLLSSLMGPMFMGCEATIEAVGDGIARPDPAKPDNTAEALKVFVQANTWCMDGGNQKVIVKFQEDSKLTYLEILNGTPKSYEGYTWAAGVDKRGTLTGPDGTVYQEGFKRDYYDDKQLVIKDLSGTYDTVGLAACDVDVDVDPPTPPAPPTPTTPITVSDFRTKLLATSDWCGKFSNGGWLEASFYAVSGSTDRVGFSGMRSGYSLSDDLTLSAGGKGSFYWTSGSVEYVSDKEIRVSNADLTYSQSISMKPCN